MKKTFFLDLLFPTFCVICKKNGKYICSLCKAKIKTVEYLICPICEEASIGGNAHFGCRKKNELDGVVSFFVFEEPIKTIIHRLKYRPYLSDISYTLIDLIDRNSLKLFQEFTLVPIPLHAKKLRERGFNQAALLGKAIAKEQSLRFEDRLINRVKYTQTQAKLLEKERFENMKDAFKINPKRTMPKKILLVDDVWTTGSTLRSAAKVLKEAGGELVWGLTLAR